MLTGEPMSDRLSNNFRTLTLCCLLVLTLAGCDTLPSGQSGGNAASIQYPPQDAQFALGETVEVHSVFSASGGAGAFKLLANEQSVRHDQFTSPLKNGDIYQPWLPPNVGTYYLVVVLEASGGDEFRSQPVTVHVIGDMATTTATPYPAQSVTASLTATTASTATPTSTQTQSPPTATLTPQAPQVRANLDVNCRYGPSQVFDSLGALLQGQTAPILGSNSDQSWWVVELPAVKQCWVWGGAVIALGDTSGVPVIPSPRTPTPTKTKAPVAPPKPAYNSCQDYTDFATCSANPAGLPGCYWDTGLNKCLP
jgi:hypothetical protein